VLGEDLFAVGLVAGRQILFPGFDDGVFVFLGGFDELGQRFEIRVAAFDLFIDDDAVEAFLAVEEFLAEGDDVLGDLGGLEECVLGFGLGSLDAFRDLDFLFTRQQGDLAHLLEVHAYRVVEDVVLRGAGFLFLGFLLALFVALDLVGLQNLDVEVVEDGEDVVDFVLVFDGVREGFVDVVESEVTLLFGEPDELPDFFVESAGGGRIGAFSTGGAYLGDSIFHGLALCVCVGGLVFSRHRCGYRENKSVSAGQTQGLPELTL